MLIKDFIRDESGAVTTDYVMLAAMITGSSVAGTNSSLSGVENLTADIDAALRSEIVRSDFSNSSYFDDFESVSAYWSNGDINSEDDAYGGILGQFGGSDGEIAVSRDYALNGDYDYAVVEFEVHAHDSWDSEQFIVFANGAAVGAYQFDYRYDGVAGSWTTPDSNYSMSITPNGARDHTGFNSGWTDQSYTVQMTVANPGDSLNLGFGSTLNQGIGDESWSIDNVSLISTNDPSSL